MSVPRQLGTCRTCGARVLWVRTLSNKAMPLDADPTTTGNVAIVPRVSGGEVAVYLNPGNIEVYANIKDRYTSHFSTCPDAQRWRRRD